MVDIRPLEAFGIEDLERIMPGYSSDERYVVTQEIGAGDVTVTFSLRRERLERPFTKVWDDDPAGVQDQIAFCLSSGLSLGAFDGDELVGMALAEVQAWNEALWIPYFGVAASRRRQGIGLRLMEALALTAVDQGLRILVAETQNTNVPAIRFYRRAGFGFDAVDLSYYSNHDVEDGEVALFMKRRLRD